MATFNFTVRATDNRGAYADRDFSITVRNTVVNRYLALASNGTILVSPNATNWTAIPGKVTYTHRRAATYGNGMWLITNAGLGETNYITSYDGIEWVNRTFQFVRTGTNVSSNPPVSVHFANGLFVAVVWEGQYWSGTTIGYPRYSVYRSQDGINWTIAGYIPFDCAPQSPANSYPTIYYWNIAYGNGQWMFAPNNANSGVTYSQYLYNIPHSLLSTTVATATPVNALAMGAVNVVATYINSLTFNNGMFVLTLANTPPIYSYDGYRSWNTLNFIAPANYDFHDVAYGNGRLVFPRNKVAGVSAGATEFQAYTHTTNLTVFNSATSLPTASNGVTNTGFLNRTAVFHNGKFVVSSYNGSAPVAADNNLSVSTDGLAWTSIKPIADQQFNIIGLFAIDQG